MKFTQTQRYLAYQDYINMDMKFVQVFLGSVRKEGSLKVIMRRPYKIEVSYTTQEGIYKKKLIQDFEARVFFHEFDHLNGKTFDNTDLITNHIEMEGEGKSISLEV